MVRDTRIRERMAAITDAKVLTAARVEEIVAALPDVSGGKTEVRDGLSFVFQQPPVVITDRQGNALGVEVWVRVYKDGVELHVDGHRRFMNPPTLVPDGTFRDVPDRRTGAITKRPNYKEEPREALLQALSASIADVPNEAGWS